MIIFSAKVSEKHQNRLTAEFPDQEFIFCQSKEEANKYVEKATVYVTYGSDIDEAFIEKAKQLQWIHVLSAGVDGLPNEVIQENGIVVTNVRGIHSIQMAEYTISMLLQVYRQAKTFIHNEDNQTWIKAVKFQEITGKTMMVVGAGAIGTEVARLGKAFRMHTIGVSKSGRKTEFFDENYPIEELNQILPKADFVISVLPSTEETKDIYTMTQFQAMAKNAIFLNMGRGDAVIEDDLLKAIQEGEIAHAVLDVFQEEPLPQGHPFWTEENITITPHIAGSSPEYMTRAMDIFVENLNVYTNKKDNYINRINLNRGY